MKRHGITKAIISNIAICLIALVFFAVSVFAWFMSIYDTKTEHKIFISNFKVDLRDDKDAPQGFSEAKTVKLENMRPMTKALAYADISQNHTYRFDVINQGTVSAMYRFVIAAEDKMKKVSSDPNEPEIALPGGDSALLSWQLKYSLKISRYNPGQLPLPVADWLFEDQYVFDSDLLTPIEKANNTTLQKALDSRTVKFGDPYAVPDPIEDTYFNGMEFDWELMEEIEGFGEINATNAKAVYYEIYFWLSEKATLDSTNLVISGQRYVKTATLIVNGHFMQLIGGATWPLADWYDI